MAWRVVAMRFFASCAVLGAAGASVFALPGRAAADVARRGTILVLAGQSNALGQQSYAVDPVTGTDYLAVPNLNKADAVDKIAWESWPVVAQAPAPVPLDTPQLRAVNGTNVQIFGPEVGLARQLAADRHGPVTIVKVGWSDTSLAVDWNPATANDIYHRMVTLVQDIVSQDAQAGTVDRVRGFFWFQGPSDVGNPTWYPNYQQNLATMFSSFRKDLDMPSAPIVIAKESLASTIRVLQYAGKCSSATSDPCAELAAGDNAVRAADDWAGTNVRNVAVVDTVDLARMNGGVHLSNISQLTLGDRMAKAWERPGRYRAGPAAGP